MRRVAPFRAADVLALDLQDAQRHELDWREVAHAAEEWAAAGRGFTLRDAAGKVVGCGGALERHAGYATLWALFGRDIGHHARFVLTATRAFVADLPHRRVDALVEDRPAARRWAEAIGLRCEARMHQAAAHGGDMLIYRRID